MADPVEILGYTNVDAGQAGFAAADTPGDDAGQLPSAFALADHRAAAVAFTGILAFLAAGAEEALVQVEAGAEPRLPHLLLAHVVAHDTYVHLLQYVLVLAEVTESVFAPAGRPASAVS